MSESSAASGKPKKDDGWDVRVRETVNAPRNLVWAYLVGDGVSLWLGQGDLVLETGAAYATSDGVSGSVLAYRSPSHLKLTWRPDDWPRDTTLDLSVRDGEHGTTIVLHHEQLADRDERRMMLGHWKTVITQLAIGAAKQQLR